MTQDEIKIWFGRIQRAEILQAKHTEGRIQSIKLYKGEFFGNPISNNSETIDCNFLYENVELWKSAVYARAPYLFIRSRSTRMVRFSETMERVVNYYITHLGLKKLEKQAVVNAIIQPPGFIGAGYFFTSNKDKLTRELEQEFPELRDTKKEKKKWDMNPGIQNDDIFLKYISPHSMLWPDGYHNLLDAPYLIEREQTNLMDLLSNPTYGKIKFEIDPRFAAGKESTQTMFTMHNSPSMMPGNNYLNYDKELTPIVMYHVWDRRNRDRFTLVKNFHKNAIFEKEWNYVSDKYPYFPLSFHEIPETPDDAHSYPLSDVVPMLPQLKEFTKVTTAMMKHLKRSAALILAKRGAVSTGEASLIQSSENLDLIEFDHIDEASLRVLSIPPMNMDFGNMRNIILEDLQRVSGLNQLLGSIKGVESATESDNIRAGALLRQTETIDNVENHIRDIGQFLVSLAWQFKTRKDIEMILGEPISPEMWPDFPDNMDEARDIVNRELIVDIEAGSTSPPKDKAVERKQKQDLIGTLKANFPGRLKDDIILPQILEDYDFRDIDLAVIGFDAEEEQAAIEENNLLMQGIPLPVSPNQNHEIHMNIHSQIEMPTPASDEHLLKHQEFMEKISPTIAPQRGDSKIAPQTTTPELRRRGVPDAVDLQGAAGSIRDAGANNGRK